MLAFKVGSTPDSMVGYKSPQFIDFGWASAKLDDVMNFIPRTFIPHHPLFRGLD